MKEIEKEWQSIDRAIGYVEGFIPAVWAMNTMDEHNMVAAETVGEFEDVVHSLACSVARVRELMDAARMEPVKQLRDLGIEVNA